MTSVNIPHTYPPLPDSGGPRKRDGILNVCVVIPEHYRRLHATNNTEVMMGIVNRGAVVVKPKQSFLDWVNASPEPGVSVTLEELREDCNAYLLPDWESHEDLQLLLEKCCVNIFFVELAAWSTDIRTYPKHLSWAMFCDWFDVEASSMVINLMAGEIVDEEADKEAAVN